MIGSIGKPSRRVVLAAAAAALTAAVWVGPAQATPPLGPLIEPAALEARLAEAGDDTLVVDIRGADAYGAGSVPGAVHAPYGAWRGPASNPGAPLSAKRLTTLLRAIGAETDRPTVVVYEGRDPTDFGAAARVYWTLKASGIEPIAILNGGLAAWRGAGLALSAERVTPTPSAITASLSPDLLAERAEIAAISGGEGGALIDARPAAFYAGQAKHRAASAAGTIKGASRLQHDNWFDGGAAMTSDAASVRARLAALGVDAQSDETVVSFCNTGHWAATNWFALSEIAGVKNVKLYAGSMVDWTAGGGDVSINGD